MNVNVLFHYINNISLLCWCKQVYRIGKERIRVFKPLLYEHKNYTNMMMSLIRIQHICVAYSIKVQSQPDFSQQCN